jgi:hypothetical protein
LDLKLKFAFAILGFILFHQGNLTILIGLVTFNPTCNISCDTFPSSLIDSNMSLKGKQQKTTEEQRVRACSLALNTLRVEGHAGASRWD